MVGLAGIACSKPEAQRIIQVVVPPLEEAAQKPPEQVKALPDSIRRLIENQSLLDWRTTLPPDATVFFLDASPNLRHGWAPKEGLKTRKIPNMEGPYGEPATWPQWNQEVIWHINIEERTDNGNVIRRWAVLEPPLTTPQDQEVSFTGPLFVPVSVRWPYGLLWEGPMENPAGIVIPDWQEQEQVQQYEWTPCG